MTKLTRATELRDAALHFLALAGTWAESRRQDGTIVRFLEFRGDGISVMYRTPFQKVFSAPSDSRKYLAALLGVDCEKNLPYGLDIFVGRKVLNIEWDNKGRIDLVSFKRGEWETRLEGLASAAAGSLVSASGRS